MCICVPLCLQAWTNMVLTLLNQVLLLSDSSFLALQPALYPCLSQLSCHVTDARVRQALREWLGRVGRLYDIILWHCSGEKCQKAPKEECSPSVSEGCKQMRDECRRVLERWRFWLANGGKWQRRMLDDVTWCGICDTFEKRGAHWGTSCDIELEDLIGRCKSQYVKDSLCVMEKIW